METLMKFLTYFHEKFGLTTEISTLTWASSLLACSSDFVFTSPYNHVKQFLKPHLFLSLSCCVCVSVCVYICVCVYIQIHIHMQIHTQIQTYSATLVCIYIYIFIYIPNLHICIYTFACAYIIFLFFSSQKLEIQEWQSNTAHFCLVVLHHDPPWHFFLKSPQHIPSYRKGHINYSVISKTKPGNYILLLSFHNC